MRNVVFLAALASLVPGMLAFADPPKPAATIILSLGKTQRLEMKSHQPIRTVYNENEHVVLVQPAPDDPRSVLITGRSVGRTRITLIGEDGKKEVLNLGR